MNISFTSKNEYLQATGFPDTGKLLTLVLFFIGLFGYALPAVDYFSAVPGGLGDARFNSFLLEHVYRYVVGLESSLWSPRFFYPFEKLLFFSDNHFGSVIFYIPLRLFGFQREIAFDIWFLISIGLNYLCAYIGLRLIRFSGIAAGVGAFIFSFSLPVLRLELHAQLFYRFPIPLAFACFWNYLKGKNISSLAFAVFWTVWQFYCSIYLGVFLCYLMAAVLLAWVLFDHPKGIFQETMESLLSCRRSRILLGSILLLGILVPLVWILYQYKDVANEYHLQFSKWQLSVFRPNIEDYIRPDSRCFIGFGVWILFLVGVFVTLYTGYKQMLGRIILTGLLILVVLTANFHGKSLYSFLIQIPGVGAIRVVSRIILVMTLPVGILAAISIEYLLMRLRGLKRESLYLGLSFLVMIVLLSVEVISYTPGNTPISQWKMRASSVRKLMPEKISNDALLMVLVKPGDRWFRTEIDGMLVSQDLNIATLNGYSANRPSGCNIPTSCLSPLNRLILYARFRHIPAETVLPARDRLIVASPKPCSYDPTLEFFGIISKEQASSIALQVLGVTPSPTGGISASLQITNRGRQPFQTLSLSGYPIRLSWRLVPINEIGRGAAGISWDKNRMDLGWCLPAGESLVVEIPIIWSEECGDFLLEVSMVQDGYAWFHDLGMPIAKYRLSSKQLKRQRE